VAAIDPRHYERRYRKALRDRTVCAWLDENGTAVLCARSLTPAQAQAAVERIDLLAHAARRAGHPSTLDQIRVDILAGLLDGTLHHLDRDQIMTHLITHRSDNDDSRHTEPAEHDVTDHDVTDHDVTDHAATDAAAAHDDVAGDEAAAGRAGDSSPADEAVTGRAGDGGSTAAAEDHHRIGVEVRVALSTLLGRDELPGEIPGFGPVPAIHARAVVADQRRAEWRYAITDAAGRLLFDGTTRRRPSGLATTGPPGGIVELHVPAALLAELTSGGPTVEPTVARWTSVLVDIARRYGERDRRDLDARPDDRLPRAELRRHTQIRDRTCVGIGCRHRPVRCDQDHTVEYKDGGPTVAADLAPLCRHDHTLKGQAGWILQQPTPGAFLWISPLGGRYEVRPEPVLPPPPDACPGQDDPWHDEAAPQAPERLTLWGPDPPLSPADGDADPAASTRHHRSEHRAQPTQEST
jgi:hypothetical protein